MRALRHQFSHALKFQSSIPIQHSVTLLYNSTIYIILDTEIVFSALARTFISECIIH